MLSGYPCLTALAGVFPGLLVPSFAQPLHQELREQEMDGAGDEEGRKRSARSAGEPEEASLFEGDGG